MRWADRPRKKLTRNCYKFLIQSPKTWRSTTRLQTRKLKMSKKHKNYLSETTPTIGWEKSQNSTSGTSSIRNLGATLTPHKYTATYVRAGTLGKTKNALLVMLRDENDRLLCDHLWVKYCNAFKRMKAGDLMSFTATPYRYIKGYSGDNHARSDFSVDVSLTDFRQVRVMGQNPVVASKASFVPTKK